MQARFHLAAVAAVAVAVSPAAAQAHEAVGAWHGVLVAGANILRIVVRVKAGADGKLEGELVSPDQSPRGFPMGDVKLAGDKLSFTVPQIYGSFDGKWDPARSAWVGAWKQGAASLPLTLEKGEAAAAPPPAPKPPPAAAGSVSEVTVQGQATGTRTDIDRRSYDISKDLQTQTGSVADALRNVPSVQVDVQGNVSLRGDPNVTIMVDGKPSALFKGPNRSQILQSLPANAFERVEVMTNPSAAFRPDGSGGIINLIPKKARQMGRAGSVRATAGAGEKGQLNLNLSSVGKKWTLTGDGAWAHESQDVTLSDRRSSRASVTAPFFDSAQETSVTQKVDVLTGRAAFDYDPDSKTRISGELRDTFIQADATTMTDFSALGAGAAPLAFTRDGDVRLERNNLSANASWRRKFGSDPDHELVADLTQEHNTDRTRRSDRQVSAGPTPPSRQEDIRSDTDTDQTHVKVDYTRPFAENAKLKAGYELEYDQSDFDNFGLTGPLAGPAVPNPGLIDRFGFKQAINGVYATWQQPVGDVTVLGGLRVEDTRIDLSDATTSFRGSNDFTRLYPSLHLSWKVDDARQVTASYAERIVRPQPSDYNPFPLYRDPFNFQAGNPNLKPQQTHSFELGGQYRKGFTYYLATLYWRQNEKGVTDVITDLGGGVLLTTKQNLGSSRSGGLELVASGRLGSKLTYGASTDAFWQEIDATPLGFTDKRSGWTFSGRGALTWQATAKDQFQLVGQLTGKRLTPQGYHEPLGLLFAGYRHQFNKDWSLSVSARDLLGSFKDVLVIDTPNLRDRVETKVKLRAVFLSLTYNFGSGPRKDTGIDYGTSTAGAGGAPR